MADEVEPQDEDVLEVGQSPTPVKITDVKVGPVSFDFYEALRRIVDGKKVTKLEWKDNNFYGVMENQIVKIHKSDGKNYSWILSNGDVAGEDYVEL